MNQTWMMTDHKKDWSRESAISLDKDKESLKYLIKILEYLNIEINCRNGSERVRTAGINLSGFNISFCTSIHYITRIAKFMGSKIRTANKVCNH